MSNPIFDEALVLLKTEKRKQALNFLVHYVKQNPDDANAWYKLAQAVEETDRKIYCLERSLILNPDLPEAAVLLADLKSQIQSDTVLVEDTNFVNGDISKKYKASTLINQNYAHPLEPLPDINFQPQRETSELVESSSRLKDQPVDPVQYKSVFTRRSFLPEEEPNSTARHLSAESIPDKKKTSSSVGGSKWRLKTFLDQQKKVDRFIFYFVFVLLILCIPIILLLALRITIGL
jgi:hypothetical protein